jgi:hypothetical protein
MLSNLPKKVYKIEANVHSETNTIIILIEDSGIELQKEPTINFLKNLHKLMKNRKKIWWNRFWAHDF